MTLTMPAVPAKAAGRGRRRFATVCAVGGSLFLTMMTAGLAGTAGTAPWNVAVGFVLNAVAAVALIRRHEHPWPVLALSVLGPLFFATDGTAALIALFAVASSVRDRRLAAAAAVVWVACGVSLTYDAYRRRDYSVLTFGVRVAKEGPAPEWNLPVWLAWTVAGALVAMVVGGAMLRRTSTQLARVETALDDRTRESAALAQEMAIAAERARIARDMHDTLAATLSRISLTAGGLQVNSTEGPERVANTASLIQKTAHDGLDELKRIIGVLRGGADPSAGSGAQNLDGVYDLVGAARTVGVHITVFVDVASSEVGPLSGHVAYRLVREALTNAGRHAVGSPVALSIVGDPDTGLRVEVRNRVPGEVPAGAASGTGGSGAGGSGTGGTGTGLQGVGEVVRDAGGTFSAFRYPEEFVVSAWLPWFS